MVLALEANPQLEQKLRAAADYAAHLPILLAGVAILFAGMYLEQLLEDITLMMAL